MAQQVIRKRDLYFFQIIMLLCDTSLSGIQEDKRFPYYYEVQKWSNLYAYQIGLGGSYGHGFKPVKLPDIVCYYGLIVRDGVQGVTIGAIYRRCQIGYGYDEYIAQVMNYKFWIQIKIVKNSAAMTQQLIKDSKFIVQAKNSITYGDALLTMSIF